MNPSSDICVWWVVIQVFTNADQNHAAIVLRKMGLEGCFEGIICFETLNPPPLAGNKTLEISAGPPSGPKSKILCKPSVEAMEAACQIAGVDPKKTVRWAERT